jgi:hypothetical protein
MPDLRDDAQRQRKPGVAISSVEARFPGASPKLAIRGFGLSFRKVAATPTGISAAPI